MIPIIEVIVYWWNTLIPIDYFALGYLAGGLTGLLPVWFKIRRKVHK